MKILYLSIFLIIFPISFVAASTTGELGDDVPESQLLTPEEISAYQAHMNKIHASAESNPNLKYQLKPNGYHGYYNLSSFNNFDEMSQIFVGSVKSEIPGIESKINPLKKQIEFYIHPILIRDLLGRLEKEKALCLIL